MDTWDDEMVRGQHEYIITDTPVVPAKAKTKIKDALKPAVLELNQIIIRVMLTHANDKQLIDYSQKTANTGIFKANTVKPITSTKADNTTDKKRWSFIALFQNEQNFSMTDNMLANLLSFISTSSTDSAKSAAIECIKNSGDNIWKIKSKRYAKALHPFSEQSDLLANFTQGNWRLYYARTKLEILEEFEKSQVSTSVNYENIATDNIAEALRELNRRRPQSEEEVESENEFDEDDDW